MKKNELVHFHALLITVAEEFVEADLVTEADLADYDVLGVSPLALRAARDDHETAVLTLARLLAAAVATDPPETQAARAD